jgi:biopolymer transport protein ExbD
MLDIVFIMLIFFIVTTSFVKEKGLNVHRPDQTQSSHHHPTTSLSIQIAENGQVMVNQRLTDMSRLVANIQVFLAENNVNSVAVIAHPKVKHQLVVEAVNLAKQAGIQNISMLLEK